LALAQRGLWSDFMANTVIGPGLVIEGEVVAEDEVIVQGTIRGKLTS